MDYMSLMDPVSLEQLPFGFLLIDVFHCTNQRPPATKRLYEPFRLPITYVDASSVYSLSSVVSTDLELAGSSASDNEKKSDESKGGMYSYLFQPQHAYAEDMIQEWKKSYTTDVGFLKDSQAVLTDMVKYEYKMFKADISGCGAEPYVFDASKCSNITDIWYDVKEDNSFLERYSFIEWDLLKSFNQSESFLQILSVMNLSSPIMSLLLPVLFLIFPFIILMIQRIPITFEVYLETLKEIARNHFIGKAIFNIQHLTVEKAMYLLTALSLYLFQIYQNVMICYRFYRNIQRINQDLCDLREYVAYSVRSMKTFCELNREDKPSFEPFIAETEIHCGRLRAFVEMLDPIRPFSHTMGKVWEFGYLLKSLYEFYSNPEYDASIRYSIGFEGYINNMRGVSRHLQQGFVAPSRFLGEESGNSDLEMEAQYYPPAVGKNPVKNRCSLAKNAIITGPNASGKTTFLKTTTINIIFSQQVGCGFYRSCSMRPYTHIHSYLNIPDTSGRDSLFQAESRRCKEIIDIILANQSAKDRHYCIFDELYSGTNPTEATKSAYAFLKYLGRFENVDFILTTHYLSVCKRFKRSAVIQNYKMDADVDSETGKINYNYKIKRGISKIQGAVKILEEMEYPREILDTIQQYGKME